VIESKEGMLGSKIRFDGQWRFPAQDSVPDKFKKCIVYSFEYFINTQDSILWRWSMLFSKTGR
jgi:hypothetical protein